MKTLNIYQKAALAEYMAKYGSKDWYYVYDMDKYYNLYSQTFIGILVLLQYHYELLFEEMNGKILRWMN